MPAFKRRAGCIERCTSGSVRRGREIVRLRPASYSTLGSREIALPGCRYGSLRAPSDGLGAVEQAGRGSCHQGVGHGLRAAWQASRAFVSIGSGLARRSCLSSGRALRVPRARAQAKVWAHVSKDVMISSRAAEVEDRAVPGHWEGDLINGLNRSAIGTLVERSTRFTMLVHLPREKGYGLIPRTKNGSALAGYGAVSIANALKKTVTDLPIELWRSLNWDRGKELSDHARFTIESGVMVFFADPHSPWQRGTNENTNGLLRQYFPKGTDLSRWSAQEIQAVAHVLNNRPRKTLGWKAPAEALNEYLKSVQQSSATTG